MTIKSKIKKFLGRPKQDDSEKITLNFRPPLLFVCDDEICNVYFIGDEYDGMQLNEDYLFEFTAGI